METSVGLKNFLARMSSATAVSTTIAGHNVLPYLLGELNGVTLSTEPRATISPVRGMKTVLMELAVPSPNVAGRAVQWRPEGTCSER